VKTSARAYAASGATSVGFSTTVQPAASAAPTFSTIWCRGKFHGVMHPTTPTGSRTISELPTSRPSKSKVRASSAKCAKLNVGRPTCTTFAHASGMPMSLDSSAASSSVFATIASWVLCSRSARSAGGVCDQVANAVRAAATALSTSAAVPSATSAMTCSVAGLTTAMRPDPLGRDPLAVDEDRGAVLDGAVGVDLEVAAAGLLVGDGHRSASV
jgi:hypothetical protein